jgi:hypothetical protein
MSTSLVSTSSLVPSAGGESGYAASEESVPTSGLEGVPVFTPTPGEGGVFAGVGGHGSAALNSSRFEDNVPTGDIDHPQGPDVVAPTGDFTPSLQVQGSTALNSGRVEDTVPTGDMELSPNRLNRSAGAAPTGDFTPRVEGSAALNSSRFEDNIPAGDFPAPSSGLDAGVQSEEGQEADDDANSGAGEEDVINADQTQTRMGRAQADCKQQEAKEAKADAAA